MYEKRLPRVRLEDGTLGVPADAPRRFFRFLDRADPLKLRVEAFWR